MTVTYFSAVPDPPTDLKLVNVTTNQLSFNWSSVDPQCIELSYNISASPNCGNCVSSSTSVTCSEFQLSTFAHNMCTVAVKSIVCENITGTMSSVVHVTLRGEL